MASTYPLEIVLAARWIADPANAGLKGEQLSAALDAQTWDPSVKSLVPSPMVLTTMSDELDWTQQVGDAFLAQQADVLAGVQRLRQQAQSAGTLQTNDQQTVIVEPAAARSAAAPASSASQTSNGGGRAIHDSSFGRPTRRPSTSPPTTPMWFTEVGQTRLIRRPTTRRRRPILSAPRSSPAWHSRRALRSSARYGDGATATGATAPSTSTRPPITTSTPPTSGRTARRHCRRTRRTGDVIQVIARASPIAMPRRDKPSNDPRDTGCVRRFRGFENAPGGAALSRRGDASANRQTANRAAAPSPRPASGGGARQATNQRPSADIVARQPAPPRPQPAAFQGLGNGSQTRAQADRGHTSHQAAASAPRASPPHRAPPPLRALGRAPAVPGPVAAGEDADRLHCQKEMSIDDRYRDAFT